MSLTLEQIAEMAPDPASAAAGKKLMGRKNWNEAARNEAALWGLCQGSAVYQVKVDLATLGYHCSCPSRKFPCKHVLGLLMLWAASPAEVAETSPPVWAAEWLAKRQQREQKKVEKQEAAAAAPAKPVDEKAQQRRAAQRESRVGDGLARLDVWLRDLVRNGLAAVESTGPTFWEEQAKRLVDAQAPGLASRVARLSSIPRATPDWPSRLLAELGRIKLMIHAYTRIDQLDPPLQSELRQILGWNVAQEDLVREGQQVADTWAVVGQWVDDDDRVRAQRSWLIGRESRRTALVLQFSVGGQPFAESIVPGAEQQATLVLYPGAAAQRAKFLTRTGTIAPLAERPPGMPLVDEFLASVAEQLSRAPWLTTFGAVLHDVTIVKGAESWLLRDRVGHALPLLGREYWKLLAITGGHPFDLAAEWDGAALRPLGMFLAGTYRVA